MDYSRLTDASLLLTEMHSSSLSRMLHGIDSASLLSYLQCKWFLSYSPAPSQIRNGKQLFSHLPNLVQ
uniref:Uncharacterized protein n=1 Tax=Arundo donax TaxID=35708 RepID=A0A0A9E6S2_ARUDO